LVLRKLTISMILADALKKIQKDVD